MEFQDRECGAVDPNGERRRCPDNNLIGTALKQNRAAERWVRQVFDLRDLDRFYTQHKLDHLVFGHLARLEFGAGLQAVKIGADRVGPATLFGPDPTLTSAGPLGFRHAVSPGLVEPFEGSGWERVPSFQESIHYQALTKKPATLWE